MRTILKATGILLFGASFVFASTNSSSAKTKEKALLIPVNSSQGQIILKTESEYRKYLDKKISKAEMEKYLFIAAKKNCQDIYLLKKAIVKIIKKLNQMEKENQKQDFEINKLKKQLNGLKEKDIESLGRKISNLHKQNKINKKEINEIASAVSGIGLSHLYKNVERNMEKTQILKKNKLENVCQKKEIVVGFDKNKIKESYIKFNKPKEFTVIGKYVYLYDYPLLRFSKVLGKINQGSKVIGDMYTKAGWVHVSDKEKNLTGWVKGYLIYPKVLYSLKNPSIKNSAFIRKNIVECIKKTNKGRK